MNQPNDPHMKVTIILGLLLAMLGVENLNAQTVSTYWKQAGIRFEGVDWDKDGRIYAVDFGAGKVYKLQDSTLSQFPGTFASAAGGIFDPSGNFYFSQYGTGQVMKITPEDSISVFCEGFYGPTGILIDELGQTMYVANYDSNRISRVDMRLSSPFPTTLAQGGLIDGPDGLAFSPEGDLISANFDDNSIQRITLQGAVSQFAVVSSSPNTGYLVRGDSAYYVAGAFGPDVYRISLDGTVSVLAGSGIAGQVDGAADTARFRLPNGLALSPTGDTLLVTETHSGGLIRLITGLKAVPDTIPTAVPEILDLQSFRISPNPGLDYLVVNFSLQAPTRIEMLLLDVKGKVVDTLLRKTMPAGAVEHFYQVPAQLSKGTYILSVQTDRQRVTRRVLLK
jgi:sugar lactone lactonase YvrE